MTAVLFISLFVFIILGVPIAVALGAAAMLALSLFSHAPIMILIQKAYNSIDSMTLMAIPFFILAGDLMSSGGVSQRLVDFASSGFGRFRGGLAHIVTVACTFFGAISGSAPATSAAIGSVMVEPMQKKGYEKDFTAAVIASSGTIGLIIPPSNNMVIFGVLTGASVGKMFIGGIFPGLIMCAGIMFVNFMVARKKNYPVEPAPTAAQIWRTFKEATLALCMPLIILGGIYGGVFTPTEAAVVAAFYGVIVGTFVYKNLNFKIMYKCVLMSARSTAIIMYLVATAACFSYILASERIPQALTQFMLQLSNDPTVIIFLICGVLMIVGTFLDNAVALILVTPIFFPVVESMGVDPVFFGVLTVFVLAIGQITPPVGMCLYIASSMAGVTLEQVSLRCIPYILVLCVIAVLLIFCPQIVLFLPGFTS
jgi:C4-dicarboxylate transporter DctM subunit